MLLLLQPTTLLLLLLLRTALPPSAQVRVMRTKALPAKYRKGGRVFFHRSTLDADTMELKPLAAAATASASAPN